MRSRKPLHRSCAESTTIPRLALVFEYPTCFVASFAMSWRAAYVQKLILRRARAATSSSKYKMNSLGVKDERVKKREMPNYPLGGR